jgi:inner membrane protein
MTAGFGYRAKSSAARERNIDTAWKADRTAGSESDKRPSSQRKRSYDRTVDWRRTTPPNLLVGLAKRGIIRKMASPIAHFIVGAALALPAVRSARLRRMLPLWAIPVIAGLLAVIPDVDVLWFRRFPYDSALGHRGFSHAPFTLILFASALAGGIARTSRRAAAQLALVWATSAVTHPLLDMLTDRGTGVMVLFPFSLERRFFSWRPIHVSPLNALRLFSGAGYILKSELAFCLTAVAIGVSVLRLRRPATVPRPREASK